MAFGHYITVASFLWHILILAEAYGLEDACRNVKVQADIVFVLDASFSIRQDQFEQQLQFVEDVTEKFPLSKSEIRVGLLTFSQHVHPAFYLNTYRDFSSLKLGIRNATYAGKWTATAEAIKFTRNVMFSARHGARFKVPKLMIIITDGNSENRMATINAAKLCKSGGIKILVIGVGNGVDSKEINAVSSDPASKYTYNVTGYDKLRGLIGILSKKACTESKRRKPVTKPETQLKRMLRLSFLFDETTVTLKQKRHIQKSIALMVKLFDRSQRKTRFSLFSHFDFRQPQQRSLFLSNLQTRWTKSKSLKRLLKLLYKTYSKSLPTRYREIAVVFTSGKLLQNPRIQVELHRISNKFELYVVNMSKKYTLQSERFSFCKLKSKQCVYTVTPKCPINDILISIKQQICHYRRCKGA